MFVWAGGETLDTFLGKSYSSNFEIALYNLVFEDVWVGGGGKIPNFPFGWGKILKIEGGGGHSRYFYIFIFKTKELFILI